MNKNLKNKKILVTGGNGFLGKYVVKRLKKHGVLSENIKIPSSKEYDLRKREDAARAVKNMDVVIHLAANVGGIGYNLENPGSLFYDNLTMGVHMMEEARLANIKKFVAIGTVCAYPKFTPIPFREEDLWNGYPEETNAPYGLAKKMLLVQAQAYRRQYDFNAIFLLPVNLYGPYDDFSLKSSHVIPALIRKFVEAKEKNLTEVIIWGTGKPTREFLYVDDAAEGIVLALEKYNDADPVNLGSSVEITIEDLAKTISDIVGYSGKMLFDIQRPDGQPRRKLDVSKAYEKFGFKSTTSFQKGLEKTIAWYKKTNVQI